MKDLVFERTTRVPRTAAAAYAWLASLKTLRRLVPPWERFRVIRAPTKIVEGSTVELETRAVGKTWSWKFSHSGVEDGREFTDRQTDGPFAAWSHLHRVTAAGAAEAEVTDRVTYRLPGGVLGRWLLAGWARRKLERFFWYAHETMLDDLSLAERYGSVRKMRVLIAGASGLVGQELTKFLISQGHEVLSLVRRKAETSGEVQWDPAKGELDPHVFRGVDVVVNLSGVGIAEKRWSEAQKKAILESRLQSTQTLVKALGLAKHRPFVLVNSSAVGVYGDSGDKRLFEDSGSGPGFLADVCRQWESAASSAENLGIRVVLVRTATVVSSRGGALPRLLTPFRLGVGGPIGDPENWVSWISLDDLVAIFYHAMLDTRCSGPVNAVAPGVLKQREWAQIIGKAIRRPSWFRLPGWMLKGVFGEMANETLLVSQRVQPGVLQRSGFVFRHANLRIALNHTLGREPTHLPDAPRAPRRRRRS